MSETLCQSVVTGVTQMDSVPWRPASGGVPKAMKIVTSAEKVLDSVPSSFEFFN